MKNQWAMGDWDFSAGSAKNYRTHKRLQMTGATSTTSAGELGDLKARSRHIIANNPYADTAKAQYVSNVVGNGFNIQWPDKEVQKYWEEFEEDPMIDKKGNLTAALMGCAGDLFEEGEAFFRFRTSTSGKSLLGLQWISPQRCDLNFSDATTRTRQGITFKKTGAPEIYHLFKENPFSSPFWGSTSERVEIPAADILHTLQRHSADQLRGIPMLSASLLFLYEIDELTEATLMRQKAAQAVGWVVQKHKAGELPAFGEIIQPSDGRDSEEEEMMPLQKVKIGGIHYLRSDEEIKHVDIKDIGANFLHLLQSQLRAVAAQCFTTYEAMTGDLSDVNFSSGRIGLIACRRLIEQHQQCLIMWGVLRPIVEKFKTRLGLRLGRDLSGLRPTITPPRWVWVDRLGDTKADVLELKTGLKTMEMLLQERGLTTEQWNESKLRSAASEELLFKTRGIFNENATAPEQSSEDESDAARDEPAKPKKAKDSKEETED